MSHHALTPGRIFHPVTDRIEFEGHGGIRLAGDARGPKGAPAVLLLHGGGQTRYSWGGTADVLAELGYRAYTLDSRGHGESQLGARRAVRARRLRTRRARGAKGHRGAGAPRGCVPRWAHRAVAARRGRAWRGPEPRARRRGAALRTSRRRSHQ
ncbi:MAG: hypothetical protein F2692_16450 [Actinobacteria bacterium]|nr:hypothetical protein [Actinomycetota bacterium]